MPPVTRQIKTLREGYDEFASHPAPRLLAAELLVLLVVRLLWTRWSVTDAAVVAVLVGLQPFTEWVIHVYVLHCPADGRRRDYFATPFSDSRPSTRSATTLWPSGVQCLPDPSPG